MFCRPIMSVRPKIQGSAKTSSSLDWISLILSTHSTSISFGDSTKLLPGTEIKCMRNEAILRIHFLIWQTGVIWRSLQIESFCETYEKYCDGIRDAFHLLVALKKTTDLEQFLSRASVDCGKLTLSTFLQKPIEARLSSIPIESMQLYFPNKELYVCLWIVCNCCMKLE